MLRSRSLTCGAGLQTGVFREVLPVLATLAAACGVADGANAPCTPDDADGIIGGSMAFEVTVDETGFSPTILAAQNTANVTLTLRNTGGKRHSFVLDCMPTPNINGCPTTSCFDVSASIEPIGPGDSAMARFVVPRAEGIHYYHSDVPGDAPDPCSAGAPGCGQFIVK